MVSVLPWPFDEPRDRHVLTSRQVVEGEQSILCVIHEEGALGWRLFGTKTEVDDLMLITLEEAVELDFSIWELADLPYGWRARRASADESWIRESASG